MSDIKTLKLFIGGTDTVTIICPECGKSKVTPTTHLTKIRRCSRVKCSCGSVFILEIEKRKHYRKDVHLYGEYVKKNSRNQAEMIVQDLSVRGMRFQVFGEDLVELQEIAEVAVGDIISVMFTLDNLKKSVIRADAIVSRISAGCICAQFRGLEEYAQRELGFYLMP